MIVYNMRYRGSIEYEKMLLNILNFHNHVHAICVEEHQESELEKTIASYIKQCNRLIEDFEKEDGVAMALFKKEMAHFVLLTQGIGESY